VLKNDHPNQKNYFRVLSCLPTDLICKPANHKFTDKNDKNSLFAHYKALGGMACF
jgi:hypothetical protein